MASRSVDTPVRNFLTASLLAAVAWSGTGTAWAESPSAEPRGIVPPHVEPLPDELREAWKLDDFYQKSLLVEGFPIIASGRVSDFALAEAAHTIRQILTGRDDVLKAMTERKVRLVIMSPTEFTTQVPEHRTLRPADWWDRRARGLGANAARPAVSCGEENVLNLLGDPYVGESILVHEFAHALFDMGVKYVQPELEGRLAETYRQAMEQGLWKETYAATNASEYWAEGVQIWFHCNRTNCREHNHIATRDGLREYDPRFAELLETVFRDNGWVYTPTTERGDAPHLTGFDREKAATFSWPERLKSVDPRQRPAMDE